MNRHQCVFAEWRNLNDILDILKAKSMIRLLYEKDKETPNPKVITLSPRKYTLEEHSTSIDLCRVGI